MDRFDLEDKIMKISMTGDDIDTLANFFMNNPEECSEDSVANALVGLSLLHKARHYELWESFIASFNLDGYRDFSDDDNESVEESIK